MLDLDRSSNCSNPGLETLRNWIAMPASSIVAMRASLRSSSVFRRWWLWVSMTSGRDGSSQTRTFSSVTSNLGGRVRLSSSAMYAGVKKWDSRSIFGIRAMADVSLPRSE